MEQKNKWYDKKKQQSKIMYSNQKTYSLEALLPLKPTPFSSTGWV
jgi:hypothetical protein